MLPSTKSPVSGVKVYAQGGPLDATKSSRCLLNLPLRWLSNSR
ncbi:hypothetical protein GEW_06332, partial [Pasteurella multocida subsp. gallicida str. Anand1_poultry]